MEQVIQIEGMSCQHCVRHVTEALQNLEGIRQVEVNLDQGQARIEADRLYDLADFQKLLEDTTYQVSALLG